MDDFFFEAPIYWDKLSDAERKEYNEMKKAISSPACKTRRSKSVETFADVLETIKAYVMRGDEGDMIRGIVCGMYWSKDGDLAINTRQLRTLLNKCKSSINGSLQSLGYVSPHSTADTPSTIIGIFPFWKDNFRELRQWTIRRKLNKSKISISPRPIFFSSSVSKDEQNQKINDSETSSSTQESDDASKQTISKENENIEFEIIQTPPPAIVQTTDNQNEVGVELCFGLPSGVDEEILHPYDNSKDVWEMQMAQEFNL